MNQHCARVCQCNSLQPHWNGHCLGRRTVHSRQSPSQSCLEIQTGCLFPKQTAVLSWAAQGLYLGKEAATMGPLAARTETRRTGLAVAAEAELAVAGRAQQRKETASTLFVIVSSSSLSSLRTSSSTASGGGLSAGRRKRELCRYNRWASDTFVSLCHPLTEFAAGLHACRGWLNPTTLPVLVTVNDVPNNVPDDVQHDSYVSDKPIQGTFPY